MPLPDHFMVSDNGNLYDTRQPNWSHMPLRPAYKGTRGIVETVAHVKAALRAGAFTGLGGYPLYFITGDSEAVSFDAIRDNFREVIEAFASGHRHDSWLPVAIEVNYEDAHLTCAHTGKPIPSAYSADEEES